MVKVVLVVNGSKKKALQVGEDLSRLLADRQIDSDTLITERSGHAIELVQNSQADGVVALGGDGTINECIQGIMRSERDPFFTAIPLGSGNDLSRSIHFPDNPEELASQINEMKTLSCDVCSVKYGVEEEYFINIADAGFGPAVVDRVERMPRWLGANLRFSFGILRTFLSYKKRQLSVNGEGFEWNGKSMIIAVANGKYFGSGLCIAPMARVDDGVLEVICVGDISLLDYLKQLPKLKKGQKIDHPEVHYFRSPWVKISGQSRLEKDGEMGGELPVRIECMEKVLEVWGMADL